MKLKCFVFIGVLFVGGIQIAVAQSRAAVDLRSNLGMYSGDLLNFYNEVSRNKMMEPFDLTEIDGSPYLDNEFKKGNVITKDSVQYAGLELRYNIYNDALEFRKNDLDIELNENFPLLYAVVGDDVFVKASNAAGYFQVVQTGDAFLVKKIKVKFVDRKEATGYQAAKKPSFKLLKPDYFVEKELSGEAFRVESNEDLLRIFSDRQDEIETYFKKEKIKVSKESDLIKFWDYYNSIK
ncbi:hypothetical protein [Mangrovibacterium sp.]|uniref:hypothetical protein n=1 Tax=Mangrovibacterium sp. TaxID=1961364 RepID=UPI0035670220